MSLWTLFDGGHSIPQAKTVGQKLALRVGTYLATRHAGVDLGANVRISPDARIHPRGGKIHIGSDSIIAPGAMIQGSVEIGSNCTIQSGTILVGYGDSPDAEGGIRIGNGVRIAPFVQAIGANHRFDNPGIPIARQGMDYKSIEIEDNVWVGGRVIIMAGVTVRSGAILAAGAVVTKDVAPNTIVGGVPARPIKIRPNCAVPPTISPESQ